MTTKIQKSKEYAEKIYFALDGRQIDMNNKKELIVTGFLSLSREHHSSIILLVEKGVYSSAFALLRPLFESVYRGLWVSMVATDEELEKIYNEEYKFSPQLWKYAEDIDEKNETNTFHKRLKQKASFLNGMTHGGIEQLVRQFSQNGNFVQPSFSDSDLRVLLKDINALIGIFLINYSNYQSDNKLEVLGHKILGNQ